MSINKYGIDLSKIRPSDRVKSDYHLEDADVVRRVIGCEKRDDCSTGYLVRLDAGEVCPTCHRPRSMEIVGWDGDGVDGNWITEVYDD